MSFVRNKLEFTYGTFLFFFTFINVEILFLGLAHCYPTGSFI